MTSVCCFETGRANRSFLGDGHDSIFKLFSAIRSVILSDSPDEGVARTPEGGHATPLPYRATNPHGHPGATMGRLALPPRIPR